MSDTASGSQTNQNWNPVLGSAELTALMTLLQTMEAKLPFLVGLTSTERQRLCKAGTRSAAFVSDAIATALQSPGLLPAIVPTETLQSKLETLENLRALQARVTQLKEQLDDTEMQLGSELFGIARVVYKLMDSPLRVPGLTERRAALAQRYTYRKKKAEVTDTQTKAA